MQRCWTYWIGIALFLTQPVLFVSSVEPVALGSVCVLSLGLLLAGLLSYASGSPGIRKLTVRFALTCIVILLSGAVLFQVTFALVRDKSCDKYVGNVLSFCFIGALLAFIYGIFRQLRTRKIA